MMTVTKIETVYAAPKGHVARAYWIPMSMYDEVRAAYKAAGIPIRAKFRGPRKSQVGVLTPNGHGGYYARTERMANQTCLKSFATHFSVYNK